MKHKLSITTMGLLLIVGGVMMGLAVLQLRGLGGASATSVVLAQSAQTSQAQAVPSQNSAVQLVGTYSGAVKLGVTVGGVYSDTLVIPPAPSAGTPAPPDMGSIDLSLELMQTGSALSGHVSLEKTLVYSVEHTLGTGTASVKIGPYVSGTFDGTTLTVQSERVAATVNGQTIQRQFRLTGTSGTSDGSQVTGEYRETVWGYTSVPVTVIGAFTLQRPVFDDNTPTASNQSPITLADSATTTAGNAITINILVNDSDPNNDPLTITSVSKPQFGTATISGTSVIYTPNNFAGTDTFSYVVSDGQGGTAVGSVTVTVTGSGQSGSNAIYLPLIQR